ncbi:pyrophosphate-energized vacuolar membrane proton pump 1 [Eucalyptus grandis]|uniref:pyrophosphate-energized vacuolar membrane proton pump 1 n=1 Tax=Eucalyptus grandis TaxID=71139 RepID=UPI00192EBBA9|nr:pyrophosphate-energized vacuolar membrane proton pump 1 [Eucalyptus grandis]
MEYRYGGIFMVAFAIIIFLCLGSVESFSTQSQPCKLDPSNMCKPALATAVFSAVSFLLGAFTSVLSGFLGMQIAIYANARTALEERKGGVGKAFFSAFRSGAVMGFLLAANGLLVLYIAINLFKLYYGNDWEGLFKAIAGYGLGGSSMALLGRAAGGIYAKATDVSVHLVKETWPITLVDRGFPTVIYDYVGDIVGDISGMGTDIFGSYAESSCAALVVASISSFGKDHNYSAMCYPLLISSMGILVCLMTTLFTANFSKIKEVKEIKPALRKQLIISTILMTFGIVIVSWIALPSSFTVFNFGSQKVVKNWQLCLCAGVGLWDGLIIGFITKSYTNDDISLLQDFAADSVGFGLAFVNIPILAAISILLSYSIASVYGITVTAVGMLSTIATRLAIDAYSPISDNATRIAKLVDGRAFDGILSSSNTTAAIGKEFAIESASLVSIALFGAFVSRAAISPVDVLTPKVFMGSIVGAMLPKWFSAMTMKRVGPAALKIFKVAPQTFNKHLSGKHRYHENPHYARCLKISTDASFKGMIRPGALVMLTPLIVGTFFGVETLSGVLAGSLGSVVRIAISASNTGGAWEKAKKYIRAGVSEYLKTHPEMKTRRAADEGDPIGNPLKDTSGPPLNILIQLMAVESLVFAPFFTTHGGLLFKIF